MRKNDQVHYPVVGFCGLPFVVLFISGFLILYYIEHDKYRALLLDRKDASSIRGLELIYQITSQDVHQKLFIDIRRENFALQLVGIDTPIGVTIPSTVFWRSCCI